MVTSTDRAIWLWESSWGRFFVPPMFRTNRRRVRVVWDSRDPAQVKEAEAKCRELGSVMTDPLAEEEVIEYMDW